MIARKALVVRPPPPTSFKVEIRRLPPLLSEVEFRNTMLDHNKDVQFAQYVPGKLKEKDKVDSKCYLFFINEETMNHFFMNYKKVFCDDKGQYYRPTIKKAIFQNWPDMTAKQANPLEGTHEQSALYKEFISRVEVVAEPVIITTNETEQRADEKKRFEKIKTPIIMQLEREYLQEQKLKEQIDGLQNSNSIVLKSIEKDKEITKMFIFVPKARD